MSNREKARARIDLAIQNVDPFKRLFDRFCNSKLPAKTALVDAITDFEVDKEAAEEAVDTFIVNLQFVGLLQALSGSERIVSVDHFLDELPSSKEAAASPIIVNPPEPEQKANPLITAARADFETTCFYVTPIGSDGTAERLHSDLFLRSIVEPAIESLQLKVVRADQIPKPGTITQQ